MTEGCRAVVFDEEMRKPREGVGHNQCGQDEPRAPEKNCGDEQRPPGKRTCGMKDARGRLAVGQHVVRPKF